MKTLIGLPIYRSVEPLRKCLESLGDGTKGLTDIILIDNDAGQEVKNVVRSWWDAWNYQNSEISVIENGINRHCNGAWNQIMAYALDNKYELLGLGTAAEFQPDWYEKLVGRISLGEKEVIIPRVYSLYDEEPTQETREATGGVMGIFTFMPIEAVKLVYPIPSSLKHWFGDEWIYTILRSHGWKVTILNTMPIRHSPSESLGLNPKLYEIIEQDKLAWLAVQDELKERMT